jgi:hypothetical protein
MNKHTPAPWKFTEGEYFYVNARVNGQRIFILQRKKSVVAASTAYQEAEEDRIRADCQLIAAAPDLLEAAVALKDACNRPSAARTRAEAWRALDKAIAKATGDAE